MPFHLNSHPRAVKDNFTLRIHLSAPLSSFFFLSRSSPTSFTVSLHCLLVGRTWSATPAPSGAAGARFGRPPSLPTPPGEMSSLWPARRQWGSSPRLCAAAAGGGARPSSRAATAGRELVPATRRHRRGSVPQPDLCDRGAAASARGARPGPRAAAGRGARLGPRAVESLSGIDPRCSIWISSFRG
ncbi:hypothetical protein GQ55_9G001100 [Panicum hallii var. hallii]|uniref:Uncharacterized protein n=1 Tax=Panicum hallii var. hallii TaxID=1504633 RepID=A0A2T7BXY2_9POAL|nr:hypothetical protein GQ55_9G001100 [Panicum hallii var. hallii]